MPNKLMNKLRKKKGRLSRNMDKSRKLDISEKVITVFIADDFYSKNGNINEDKKDKILKDKKFKDKFEKRKIKLIEKVNKIREKNKRMDNLILKLRMRRTKLR